MPPEPPVAPSESSEPVRPPGPPPQSPPQPQAALTPARPRRMAGAAALLSLATLLSRVLGLLREQVFAALLGAGFYGDAFTMAFRLPNLLRDLFAEGALSAAFQPAFAQAQRAGGPPAAFRLANLVLTCLVAVVAALVLLGIVLAPELVSHWAQGFAAVPGKAELTTLLTRIMMPFLLLVSVAAVAMGMLNAQERFTAPALAPALFNLATVGAGVGLWVFGIGRTRGAAIAWAVATLVGGALQLFVQVVPLWRSGFRFRPTIDRHDPGLRAVLLAMAPATIGLMATQVNIYVSSSFASSENGAVTWLAVAFRLMQLPIGMFGVAVGTVALARAAQSASESDLQVALDGIRDTLRRGLRLVSFWTLPTAVALWVLAEPILRVIYQHGAFGPRDTLAAAEGLRYYAIGLLAYAAVKVVAPVFYALGRARVPVLGTIVAVAGNVVWNVALHPGFGFRALALGTSVAALLNLAVLLVSFSRRYGGLWQPQVVLGLLRMAVAAAVMGLLLHVLREPLMGKIAPLDGTTATPLLRVIAGLGVSIGLGAACYGALCVLMQVEEVGELRGALRRRLGRFARS